MKLVLQCVTAAFGFVALAVTAAISCTFAECGAATGLALKFGTVLSPGLLLVGAIYRKLPLTLADTLMARVVALIPGILIDVAIYTVVFCAIAKLGKMISKTAALGPTTNDERPTTLS